MWVAQIGFGLPELWVHKSPQSPGVCHSHLWALLVGGLWMVSLEVGISPQTDPGRVLILCWESSLMGQGGKGNSLQWTAGLGEQGRASGAKTAWKTNQVIRSKAQNVEKGEIELFVGVTGNVRAKGFNLRVHGIHPCDRIYFDRNSFYKCQILAHTGVMEPKLGHCTVWLAQLMSVVSLCCCQGTAL